MERSRLTRVKSKKATRQAVIYIVISVLIVIAMITWGVPLAARLAGSLIRTDNGTSGIEELKPTPPVFSDIPESTNSAKVNISGFSQPGVEISLFVNGAEYKKILSDDAGVFKFGGVPVKDGDNTLYAFATTSRGTESEQSRQYTLTVDTTKPDVTLSSPTDGQVFHGERERIAEFAGTVSEEGAKVYVGDRMPIVQTDGSFRLAYQMTEGDQEVIIKVIDNAGNENEKTLKIRWEP